MLNIWENESSNFRERYETKECADQIRFMNEDEIESRHCATLTSRAHRIDTSPSNGSKKKLDHADSRKEGIEGEENYESPPKKAKEKDGKNIS